MDRDEFLRIISNDPHLAGPIRQAANVGQTRQFTRREIAPVADLYYRAGLCNSVPNPKRKRGVIGPVAGAPGSDRWRRIVHADIGDRIAVGSPTTAATACGRH